MKRTITPHKGGRDKRLEVRLSQTTLDQLAAIVASRNGGNTDKQFTVADWIAEKAAEEAAHIGPASCAVAARF